jgi:hypothetical protein
MVRLVTSFLDSSIANGHWDLMLAWQGFSAGFRRLPVLHATHRASAPTLRLEAQHSSAPPHTSDDLAGFRRNWDICIKDMQLIKFQYYGSK